MTEQQLEQLIRHSQQLELDDTVFDDLGYLTVVGSLGEPAQLSVKLDFTDENSATRWIPDFERALSAYQKILEMAPEDVPKHYRILISEGELVREGPQVVLRIPEDKRADFVTRLTVVDPPVRFIPVEFEFQAYPGKQPDECRIEGNSNLPAGTVLSVAVQEKQRVYINSELHPTNFDEKLVIAEEGKIQETLRARKPFRFGDYQITLRLNFDHHQPAALRQKFGQQGELMWGPLVRHVGDQRKQFHMTRIDVLRPGPNEEETKQLRANCLRILAEFEALKRSIVEAVDEPLLKSSDQIRAKFTARWHAKIDRLVMDAQENVLDQKAIREVASLWGSLVSVLAAVDQKIFAQQRQQQVERSSRSFDAQASAARKRFKQL